MYFANEMFVFMDTILRLRFYGVLYDWHVGTTHTKITLLKHRLTPTLLSDEC